MIALLPVTKGFYYLGTPYSKYPAGLEAAFVEAARIAGVLIAAGLPIFSPIAHSHPIAMHGGLDPLAHEIWLRLDKHMMRAAEGLIVAEMDGWEESHGLAHEIDYFEAMDKPIFYLDPEALA